MYLFHGTTLHNLIMILKDHELKSTDLISGKYEKGEGDGMYENNKFVYFSTTSKLFDENIFGNVVLYFNPKFLYNKSFYVANLHSGFPDKLGEWDNPDGTILYLF